MCQHRLVGLPRQGRRHRRGHVPRGVRDAGGVLPEGGKGARGGEAQRACVPGLSAAALEAPAHQQRARVRQGTVKILSQIDRGGLGPALL